MDQVLKGWLWRRAKQWTTWMHALIGAFIGGGATALTADQGLSLAHRMGADVPVLNFQALGIVFLAAGIYSAALYLKQAPLPPLDDEQPLKDATVKPAGCGRIVGVLLALWLSIGAVQAASTNLVFGSSPTITVNKETVVDLVRTFPGFEGVGTFAEWFKALGTNTTFQAVYSFSTEGGLSSGGVAIAESLVDFQWEIETGSVWALHLGPALVLGNDDTGVFSAAEAALWTDAFGPLFTAGEKAFGPLSWRPKQVDKLYLFLGAGIETCGDADAGHAFIVSAGVGVKF